MPETIVVDLAFYNGLILFTGIGAVAVVNYAVTFICKYLDRLFNALDSFICSKCIMRGGDNGEKQQKHKVPDNEET